MQKVLSRHDDDKAKNVVPNDAFSWKLAWKGTMLVREDDLRNVRFEYKCVEFIT